MHRHTFTDDGRGGTRIDDEIRYELPLGALGRLAHPVVRRQLERIFGYRTDAVRRILMASPEERHDVDRHAAAAG